MYTTDLYVRKLNFSEQLSLILIHKTNTRMYYLDNASNKNIILTNLTKLTTWPWFYIKSPILLHVLVFEDK